MLAVLRFKSGQCEWEHGGGQGQAAGVGRPPRCRASLGHASGKVLAKWGWSGPGTQVSWTGRQPTRSSGKATAWVPRLISSKRGIGLAVHCCAIQEIIEAHLSFL